jgi:hypothetical protein
VRRRQVRLGLGWRDVADGLGQAPMVEPVDPFERGDLDGLEAAPWAARAYGLGLEQADHRLDEGVGMTVADAADRRREGCLALALGVADGQVLGGLNPSSRRRHFGLLAASLGFSRIHADDHARLDVALALDEALSLWARDAHGETDNWPTPAADRAPETAP